MYNANLRITQSPGCVAITYALIHDTRVIPLETSTSERRPPLAPKIRWYMGDARSHWGGTTLVERRSRQPEAFETISGSTRYTEPIDVTALVAGSAGG